MIAWQCTVVYSVWYNNKSNCGKQYNTGRYLILGLTVHHWLLYNNETVGCVFSLYYEMWFVCPATEVEHVQAPIDTTQSNFVESVQIEFYTRGNLRELYDKMLLSYNWIQRKNETFVYSVTENWDPLLYRFLSIVSLNSFTSSVPFT